MSNPFQKTFSVDCSLSRLLISLLAVSVLSAVATGCEKTAPIATNQIITGGTATPEPTSQPTASSSKEHESALVRALEDNIFLMNKLSALEQELQMLVNKPIPPQSIIVVEESWLKSMRELSMGPVATYRKFIRGEVDRLKSEVKRLEESVLDYDYAFPESGFPMERKEDALALAVSLRESVVTINSLAGRGTGFVIGDDLIVTNDHVIPGEGVDLRSGVISGIVIRTFAGEEFNAELVGTDPVWDIALLRSDRPMGSPSLTWGDSRKLNLKDGVFSIGHPAQMGDWALTAGVFVQSSTISLDGTVLENFGEASEGDSGTETVVETTIPCMTGCSGSPIFNMNGEVIALMHGSEGLESTDMGEIGSFSSPVPHRIHSVPAVVSREWMTGSPAWKVQELIEEWLDAKS